MHDDGRDDKPSASRMPRIRRCPGSWAAEMEARGQVVELTQDADEGTARHSMIEAGFDAESIDDKNAAYTVSRAAKLLEDAIERCGVSGATLMHDITEIRLWVHDDFLNPTVSARLDRLMVWDNKVALVADYKTLFGDHGHAAGSEQLAVQALATQEAHPDVEAVFVAYIQPNLPKERQLTMARYGALELASTRAQLMRWIAAAMAPNPERIPGDHCTNCVARATCKEAIASSFALSVASGVEMLSPDRLGAMLDRCKMAEAVIEAVRAEAKKRISSGIAIPGWEMKDGGEQFKIESAAGAFSVVAAAGVTNEEFIGAVDVSITKLAKIYTGKRAENSDLTKAKAEEELRELLVSRGFAKKTRKAASLNRIK